MQANPIGRIDLSSESETETFARALAPVLKAGDTILLEGGIGAGKTFLCRALIQARLAAEARMEDVPSPTFTLVQVYELESVEIWHCDLYRLETPDEVLELGLEQAFETAICLVEWPDRLGALAPENALRITLSAGPGAEETRHMVLASADRNWAGRLEPVLESPRP